MNDPFAYAALILYGLWFVVAFGLRVAIHFRQTGTSGLIGLSRDASVAEWWAGALLVFSLFTGAISPMLEIAGVAPAFIGAVFIRWWGFVIAGFGIAFTFLAQIAMGRSWRIGVDPSERTELVTDGPFEFVRNPIFTAMIITMFGLTLVVANLPAVAAFFGLSVAIEIQVRAVEEPYLRKVHGRVYEKYERSVGRFYPGIGKNRSRPVARTRTYLGP